MKTNNKMSEWQCPMEKYDNVKNVRNAIDFLRYRSWDLLEYYHTSGEF